MLYPCFINKKYIINTWNGVESYLLVKSYVYFGVVWSGSHSNCVSFPWQPSKITVYVSKKYRIQAYIFQSLICPKDYCHVIKIQDCKSRTFSFISQQYIAMEVKIKHILCFLFPYILTKYFSDTGQKRVMKRRLEVQSIHIY